jgi:23S rRNA pseudouridine1911/1915/1917 synthase
VRLGWASSRRAAKDLIFAGRVHVNGYRYRKGAPIAADDRVEVENAPSPSAAVAPNPDLHIEVLYEDAAMLVVAKPGLLPCHPLRADERGTVMNAIAARYPETAAAGDKPLEGGLVHRLDNGTSGALIVARTREAFAMLRAAIRNAGVARRYRALAAGHIDRAIDVDVPIAHHPKNPRRMVVAGSESENPGAATKARHRSTARPAFTRIVPVDHLHVGNFTLADVIPRTGSRHQIRVHLASSGHPIAGDELYGGPPLDGLARGRFWLHLAELSLVSPAGGRVTVTAPLPADLTAAFARLR